VNVLATQAKELIKAHGSVRAAAKRIGVNYSYLFRMASGEKLNPSGEVLKKLGLEKIVTYRSIRKP